MKKIYTTVAISGLMISSAFADNHPMPAPGYNPYYGGYNGNNFGPFNGMTNWGPFDSGSNFGPFKGLGNFGPFKNTNDWYNDTDFGFNFNTKNKVDNKSQAAADGNFSGQADAYAKGQADAYAKGQADGYAQGKADAYARGYADGKASGTVSN